MNMWRWYSSRGAALILVLALVSCNPPVGNKRDFAESLLRTESGTTIRGSVMGDQVGDVLKRETFDLKQEEEGVLTYRGTAQYDDVEVPVTLYYTFDTYGLYEIQFDVFPSDQRMKDQIFQALKGKLTLMYGRPDGLSNGLRFSTFSPGHNIIEVTLLDDSEDQGKPFVSLNLLEQLEDEI